MQRNDTQNFPNQIVQKLNDTQCLNFNEGSTKNTHVSRSRSQNFPNNDAEIIPKLYIIRKSKIFLNIRTDDSDHIARLHTLQVRMNWPMRTSTIAETDVSHNVPKLFWSETCGSRDQCYQCSNQDTCMGMQYSVNQ